MFLELLPIMPHTKKQGTGADQLLQAKRPSCWPMNTVKGLKDEMLSLYHYLQFKNICICRAELWAQMQSDTELIIQ